MLSVKLYFHTSSNHIRVIIRAPKRKVIIFSHLLCPIIENSSTMTSLAAI
jgi:hypothetical protein